MHAADGLGVVPQVEVAHAADSRNQADHYAAGSGSPDAVPWSGDLRIVSVVVTQVSAADHVVTVELFPQEMALRPGDGVLWVNIVPGAILRVVFERTAPVVGTCTTRTGAGGKAEAEPVAAADGCGSTGGRMARRDVERTLGRLLRDHAFREEFFLDPARACLRLGIQLSLHEVEALLRVPRPALASLGARLDDRICRLHIPQSDVSRQEE